MKKYLTTVLFACLLALGQPWAQSNADFQQGKQQFAQKKYETAIASFKKATEAEPNKEANYMWLARAYNQRMKQTSNFMKKGALARKMKNAYKKAVEVAPQSVDARYSLAMYYTNAPGIAGGSFAKAEEQATAIIKLDKGKGYELLGVIHQSKKDYAAAEKAYRKGLQFSDNQAKLYQRLGMLLQAQKQYVRAFQEFGHAIKADKNYLDAYYQYARTAVFAQMQMSKGIKYLRYYVSKASAKNTKVVAPTYAWWRMGQLYELQQDTVQAKQAYQKALQLNANNKQAKAALEKLKETE
ncbi:MAG TPA: hypothetical protein DCS93_04670 [Microscillaceae bacterium]|nr:hypothetical protein [Microscillaceae bacterium]